MSFFLLSLSLSLSLCLLSLCQCWGDIDKDVVVGRWMQIRQRVGVRRGGYGCEGAARRISVGHCRYVRLESGGCGCGCRFSRCGREDVSSRGQNVLFGQY